MYWWLIPLSAIPAALFAILVIMDQHITAVIVNSEDNKLKVTTWRWVSSVNYMLEEGDRFL